MNATLQKRVDLELDAAVFENGYVDLMTYSAEELTTDIATYCDDLEDEDEEDIKRCAQEYLDWYASHKGENQPRNDVG